MLVIEYAKTRHLHHSVGLCSPLGVLTSMATRHHYQRPCVTSLHTWRLQDK